MTHVVHVAPTQIEETWIKIQLSEADKKEGRLMLAYEEVCKGLEDRTYSCEAINKCTQEAINNNFNSFMWKKVCARA